MQKGCLTGYHNSLTHNIMGNLAFTEQSLVCEMVILQAPVQICLVYYSHPYLQQQNILV
jgi:hypothetical protein